MHTGRYCEDGLFRQVNKMTREEAIAIIRKEYLCVDRDCDIERSCGKCDLMMPSKEPILQAYKLAIKALEQEPCGDVISLEVVIEWLKDKDIIKLSSQEENAKRELRELISVNPQEPSITWVTGTDGAKIAFKDVPVWKATKICEILGEPQESEDEE